MVALSRPIRKIAVVGAALVALVLAAFAIQRGLGSGAVLGSVWVGGVDLSGLSELDATTALLSYEDDLSLSPARFTIKDQSVEVQPETLGFELDEQAAIAQAMALGRTGGIPEQFRWWLGHLFTTVELPPPTRLDPAALETRLRDWDEEVVANPPAEGDLVVEDGAIIPIYPAPGERIDRAVAPHLMLDAISRSERQTVPLPVLPAQPTLTVADVESALAEAKLLLSAPVRLREGDLEAVFTEDQLASVFTAEPVVASPPHLALRFDPELVEEMLAPLKAGLERQPVDAQLQVDGNVVQVIPGSNGTEIDAGETADALFAAAQTASRAGRLPFREGAEPDVTTAELEALDIRHLVSSFTTYHDCCQNRVTNIHLLAGELDGVIVEAGETFSINGHVGERTEEEGYLPAPTILFGELEDTIGGGVSQFATTFYNAVFWGGYDDMIHSPHSYYFSRYPEGIEATISWPVPDLVFRNDSGSAILIDTTYSDTSITVRFLGNNDGRMVAGEQSRGRTHMAVLEEGGPGARRVAANISERFAPTGPTVEYRANPLLMVDEQKEVQAPGPGWSVRVTRTITIGEGEPAERVWVVRYRARNQIIEVHPCMMPNATEPCPTTTTFLDTTSTTPTTVGG